LEKCPGKKVTLFYGNTAEQRRSYIRDFLLFNHSIIDIGCGEGFYALKFAPKLKNGLHYLAVDTDEAAITALKNKMAKANDVTNLSTFNSLEELLSTLPKDKKFDVIATEIIEHMTISDGQQLIQTI